MPNRIYLLGLSLLFSVSSLAQNVLNPDSTQDEGQVQIVNFSDEIITAKREIQDLQLSQQELNEITELDSAVKAVNEDLSLQYAQFDQELSDNISRVALSNLSTKWTLNENRVKELSGKIESNYRDYNEREQVVSKNIERWNNTLKQIDDNSNDLRLRAKDLIGELQTLSQNLTKAKNSLEEIDSVNGESTELILKVEERLMKVSQIRSRNVFLQNAEPIWAAKWDSTRRPTEKDSTGYWSLLIQQNFIGSVELDQIYIKENKESFHLHLILWILTLLLTFKASKSIKEKSIFEYSVLASNARIRLRDFPFLSATFLALLYTSFLYDSVPLYVKTGLFVFLLGVLIFLDEDKSLADRLKLFVILSLILIIGRMEFITDYSNLFNRLLIMIKVFVVWFLVNQVSFSIKAKMVHYTWFLKKEHLRAISISFYVLVGTALLGNILGYIELAKLSVLLISLVVIFTTIAYGALLALSGLTSYIITNTWSPKMDGGRKFLQDVLGYSEYIIGLVVGWLWLKSILISLGLFMTFVDWFDSFFKEEIVVGNISFTLSEVFLSLVIMLLTVALTRFIGYFIKEGGLDRLELKRGVPNAISLVVRYSLIFLGFVIALSVIGVDLKNFSLIAGALGVGIGFGLQNIIANFVSGLILVFERPIQEGDVVEVRSLLGEVNKIGVRSSNIRTFSGAEVIVPNELLISEDLINWTLSDSRKRLEVLVGVEYGSDPKQIIELLRQAAVESESVLKNPEPVALFDEFGDSSLNFRLLFWVPQELFMQIRSEIMVNVYSKLNAYNINIPFPIRTLKIDSGEKEKLFK